MPLWADAHLLPAGDLIGAADDTLRHKSGRHVAHAGYYRDAVRTRARGIIATSCPQSVRGRILKCALAKRNSGNSVGR